MNNTDAEYIHTISNHPVHILDDQNIFSPSAFIPFCSLGGNMSVMGKMHHRFSYPVCDKFRPKVLKGRLCYQVDINEFKDQVDSTKLMKHGLSLMLDYNEDRMGLDTNMDQETVLNMDWFHMLKNDDKKQKAMIYIETLGMFNYIILHIQCLIF